MMTPYHAGNGSEGRPFGALCSGSEKPRGFAEADSPDQGRGRQSLGQAVYVLLQLAAVGLGILSAIRFFHRISA